MKLLAKGEHETEQAGYELAEKLRESGKSAVVCLYGELGAGKTVFARGMAMALGIPPREITSVSFTIAAEHDSTPPFCHMDLYRIARGEELEPLGVYEYFGEPWITAVEWADRLPPEDAEGAVRVRIIHANEDTREIIIEGIDEEHRDHMQMGAP